MEKSAEPQLVNTWKPVTGEWLDTAPPPVESRGTLEVESQIATAAACTRSSRNTGTPVLILVYAGYCFLRTIAMLTAFYLVIYAQDAPVTKLIDAITIPTIERFAYPGPIVDRFQAPETPFDQEQGQIAHDRAVRALPAYFLALGIPYAVSGVTWLLRNKNARMFTMFSAGCSALSGAVNWFESRAIYTELGLPQSFTSARDSVLLPAILLNLFVFLYLAYSPAVLEAFRVGEFEQ